MSPVVLTVAADDSTISAAEGLTRAGVSARRFSHDIHRLVVWDADGGIAGVVTSLDLVKAIARGAEFDVETP